LLKWYFLKKTNTAVTKLHWYKTPPLTIILNQFHAPPPTLNTYEDVSKSFGTESITKYKQQQQQQQQQQQ
jgi:hypothetical protein